jgi:hypothetical protein
MMRRFAGPGHELATAHGSRAGKGFSAMSIRQWIVTGLLAQVVGAAAQAIWHLGADRPARDAGITINLGGLADHVISTIGVLLLVVAAIRLTGAGWPTGARRLVQGGTLLEVVGVVIDLVAHLLGGESPVAFAAIGIGFLLVLTGLLLSRRTVSPQRLPAP